MDLETTLEVVLSAAWIILAPVSWCWPVLARAMEMTSPRARSPFMTTPGYFIVRREPMLQSIQRTSASSMREAALGDEVEDVAAPVLDGDVLDLRALEGDQLDDGGVQRGGLEFRRGAAFHVHHLGAFVGDDERALELAEVLRVDAEVGLQRLLQLHALRDVDERAAGKHRAVERGELVVAGRDHLAEPRAENFLVLLQAFGGVDEDDALFGELLLDVRVGGLGVELGLHAGEERAFLLGNAEPLEGFAARRRARRPMCASASRRRRDNSGSCRNRCSRDPWSPSAWASACRGTS